MCTNDAVADAKTGQILLQNAAPGKRGTLGTNTLQAPGVWNFDASMSKTFRVSESKSAQIRMDASNVLNHPTPLAPTLDINSETPFGYMTDGKSGSRDPNVSKTEPVDPDDIDAPEVAHVRAHRIDSISKVVADGSVQGLQKTIDARVLEAVAGRSEGDQTSGAW